VILALRVTRRGVGRTDENTTESGDLHRAFPA
jgi:hypothetical protein